MSNGFARAVLSAIILACGTAGHAAEAPQAPGAVEVRPMLDARLRHEHVDQHALEADALTLRLRTGAEARRGSLSFLVEGEATLAAIDSYNAFPFPLAGEQRRPQFAVIADPESLELNRLQLQYESTAATITLGRQRINLDDQRWVGSVGWRQNEQTFDAVRGEAVLGPVAVDLAYAIDQRTIFGGDAGPRASLDGDFLFAGASASAGPVEAKLFAYLIGYQEPFALGNGSQTYGGILKGTIPLGGEQSVALRVSYARQSDHGANPFDYAADYWSVEAGSRLAGFALAGGWEVLGSDRKRAVQTPLATLHKFNGWADMFLTTPPDGLRDGWFSVGRTFEGIRMLPGLNASIAFHRFESAVGGIGYGAEWDASVGVKAGRAGLLAKFAAYDAAGLGVDTRKFWLQAEWGF